MTASLGDVDEITAQWEKAPRESVRYGSVECEKIHLTHDLFGENMRDWKPFREPVMSN